MGWMSFTELTVSRALADGEGEDSVCRNVIVGLSLNQRRLRVRTRRVWVLNEVR